jgi:hypothetical protein
MAFAARMRSRRRSQEFLPAKHGGNWGKRRGFSPHGARKNGGMGGPLRIGTIRRLVRQLTGTGNRHPGLRADTMGRAAPSGALHVRRLAAPRRQRQKCVALV